MTLFPKVDIKPEALANIMQRSMKTSLDETIGEMR